jgi:HSP20 family protein
MDPFDEMERFNKQMRKFLEGLMGGSRVEIFTPFRAGSPGGELGEFREPLVDIDHDDKGVTVTAEVPGVDKKDIKLKVRKDDLGNHVLVITAQRKGRQERKSEGAFVTSMSSMSYRKMVSLPVKVKKDSARATYHNGILEVRFERAEKMEEDKGTDIRVD